MKHAPKQNQSPRGVGSPYTYYARGFNAPARAQEKKSAGRWLAAGAAALLAVATFSHWEDKIPDKVSAFWQANDSGGVDAGSSEPVTEFATNVMHYNAGGPPYVTPELAETIESCGNFTDKILLTFDDYGSDEHIRSITGLLKSENIGAIFFPNNNSVPDYMVNELRQDGFWVGNHTYDHANMHKMIGQDELNQAIQLGVDSDLFRPPYGASYGMNGEAHFDSRVLTAASSVGARVCLWEIDTMDWDGTSAQQITDSVLNNLEPGAVVLMLSLIHI